jgi:hypothetical protein
MTNTVAQDTAVDARDVIVEAVRFDDERDVIPKPFVGPLASLIGTTHAHRPSKSGFWCFSLARYLDGATRGNAGVFGMTGLSYDFDDISEVALGQLGDRIRGMACALYSTSSDRARGEGCRRVRLVVPSTGLMSPPEYALVWRELAAELGVPPDETSDVARLFYGPNCPAERAAGAFIHFTTGAVYDPEAHLAIARARNSASGPLVGSVPVTAWRSLVAEGATEGARHDATTRLSGYLLRRIDPIVAQQLVLAWNAQANSPPLPVEEVTRIVDGIAGSELKKRRGGSRHGK